VEERRVLIEEKRRKKEGEGFWKDLEGELLVRPEGVEGKEEKEEVVRGEGEEKGGGDS